MIIEYMEHIVNYSKHIDAIMLLSNDDTIEYSAYFSRKLNKFVSDDFIGKKLFDVYPNLTPETSINYKVKQIGKPILGVKTTNCDYKNRVYYFICDTFPIFINNKLVGTVEFSIYDEERYNDNKFSEQTDNFITQNKDMLRLKHKLNKIAATDSPVLIYGETGTGKELVAQALFANSHRNDKPFLTVNCSAIPPTLMESTLFGTVKGSFTGAVDRKGFFENAHRGALFLDEINSMELHLQSKLLRAIENKEIYRVGGDKKIDIDVRIIAAMNIPPEKAIEENIIRSDLYYRLGVARVNIPPLRARKDDIPLLTEYFISQYNKKMSRSIKGIDDKTAEMFSHYDWKGNIRELKNCIEYAFLVSEDDYIKSSDLPENFLKRSLYELQTDETPQDKLPLNLKLEKYEKAEIEKALKLSRNLVEVAKYLGISRQSLQYKMNKYNLM